jgi:hypothetical protein
MSEIDASIREARETQPGAESIASHEAVHPPPSALKHAIAARVA